ncbi:MAG: hypothetical protein ALAOOOJD_01845 [bacterium]|nr:hypothetical protein [bacterium]
MNHIRSPQDFPQFIFTSRFNFAVFPLLPNNNVWILLENARGFTNVTWGARSREKSHGKKFTLRPKSAPPVKSVVKKKTPLPLPERGLFSEKFWL